MRRLATSIVNRYPASWRERYEEEVLALIEDSPVRLSDLGELVRGFIIERMRALIADADHPRRTAVLLGGMQPLFVVGFVMCAFGTGVALRNWVAPSGTAKVVVMAVWLAWCLAFWPVVLSRFQRRWKGPFPRSPIFSARTGLALMPPLFAIIAMFEWASVSSSPSTVSPAVEYGLNVVRNLYYQGVAAAVLSMAFWPGRRMLHAIGAVEQASKQLTVSKTWVDSCHAMIARGIPSPLQEAEAQVERWTRKRDDSLAQVESLSYRSRFASVTQR